MRFEENKIEIGIAILSLALVGGLFRLFGGPSTETTIGDSPIVYEMPRPKSDYVGEFGLNGREIDRRYVNPFEKKKADEKAAAKAAAAKPADKKAVVRREIPQKKKAAKKPGVDIRVVQDDPARKLEFGPEGGVTTVVFNQGNRGAAGATATDEKGKEKLSPDQWRALMSQPTRENMNKLLSAYTAGEVDDATFYGILQDMMKSQKTEDQALALYALNRTPTLKSFMFVSRLDESLPAELEPAVQQFYMNYVQSKSRLGILAQALQSNEEPVALKAAEIVLAGLKLVQDPGTQDPRSLRGEITVQNTDSYALFVPIFQRWASSGDQNLVNIANSILPQLPTTETTGQTQAALF